MGQPFFDFSPPSSVPELQGLWRGDALGTADASTRASGHAALDAQLPGGGWPLGALTEVLQPSLAAPVWPLVLPALAQTVAQQRAARVVLIGPPYEPFGPALAAAGLPVEALLWVRADAAQAPGRSQVGERPLGGQRGHAVPSVGAHLLWTCEQALRCADAAAVLAWLPQARVVELRRLQLAAARCEALLFVFRPESAAQGASPARLRLHVALVPEAGQMDIRILKRRGPPLAAPVTLPARSEQLSALLAAASARRREGLSLPEAREPGRALAAAANADGTVVRLAVHRSVRQADPAAQAGGPHALAGTALAG